MTPAEALEQIKEYAQFGRVSFEDHALDQMDNRNIDKEDIYCALETATSCLAQPKERWKVEGVDTWGDELIVIVAFNGTVCILTIF